MKDGTFNIGKSDKKGRIDRISPKQYSATASTPNKHA